VQTARGYATPTVTSAKVGGHGTRRTLTYKLHGVDGVQVDFVDRDATGDHPIGVAKGASGTIRFVPAPGPGGHRDVIARAVAGGHAIAIGKVASYVAPGPPKPGRARHLRVRRSGTTLTVRLVPGRNAARTVVQVRLPGGARLQRFLTPRATHVTVRGVPRRGRLTVAVITVARTGVRATAATTRLRR
jgi:hypothetical protein